MMSITAEASSRRETPLVKAIRKAKTSIVNIHTEKSNKAADTIFGPGKQKKVTGMGAGIIFDHRGYIVTNYHVIANVDTLKISLSTGEDFPAKLISFDRKNDLAVIRAIGDRDFDEMPMGTSSDLMLGETVIAVGNPFGYVHTITSGIISSLSRNVEVNKSQTYRNVLQTDASINPGNSGGPLLNLDGEVIGINVAIRAGAQRIGFAIPIDDARKIIARLMSSEVLNKTYHGLKTTDSKHGKDRKLIIDSMKSGSPSEKAGFQTGDIVLKADGLTIVDRTDFERAINEKKVGEPIRVVVRRGKEKKDLLLSLGRYQGVHVAGGIESAIPVSSTHKGKSAVQTVQNEKQQEVQQKEWSLLGVKLKPMSKTSAQFKGTRYEGGMRITSVRANGPASRNGIRVGDILVGLHDWESVGHDDIAFVLDHPKRNNFNPLKFYILRGRVTRYVYLRLPVQTRPRVARSHRSQSAR